MCAILWRGTQKFNRLVERLGRQVMAVAVVQVMLRVKRHHQLHALHANALSAIHLEANRASAFHRIMGGRGNHFDFPNAPLALRRPSAPMFLNLRTVAFDIPERGGLG